jgi:hypothetical protein
VDQDGDTPKTSDGAEYKSHYCISSPSPSSP